MAPSENHYRKLLEVARVSFESSLLPGEMRVLEHSALAYHSDINFYDIPRKAVRPTFLRWLLTDHEVSSCLKEGGVWIANATFATSLELIDLQLSFSITFLNCVFSGGLLMFQSTIRGLHIRGCTASNVLDLSRIFCQGVITIAETQCAGTMRFVEARVHSLYISETTIEGMDDSLDLGMAIIEGTLGLSPGFIAHGRVLLSGTVVNGFFSAEGAQMMGRPDSLATRRCKFGSDIYLVGATIGANCLLSAVDVKGDCDFTGCSFGVEGVGGSLLMRDATIAGDVILERSVCTQGKIDVSGTQVKGSLSCYEAEILQFRGLSLIVGKEFRWLAIKQFGDGSLILDGANINILIDDEKSWPAVGQLSLRRASFNKLIEHSAPVGSRQGVLVSAEELQFDPMRRIRWLERQNNLSAFDAYIWMSLAEMTKARGDLPGAKRVVVAQRKHEAAAELYFSRRHPAKLEIVPRLRWLLRRTLAMFEREPLLLLAVILALSLLGTSVFWPLESRFSPTNDTAYKAVYSSQRLSLGDQPPYPKFSPFIYSLENVLPVIKLGQDDKWAPNPHLCSPQLYLFLSSLRWLLILSGWSQATILATVLGERFLQRR